MSNSILAMGPECYSGIPNYVPSWSHWSTPPQTGHLLSGITKLVSNLVRNSSQLGDHLPSSFPTSSPLPLTCPYGSGRDKPGSKLVHFAVSSPFDALGTYSYPPSLQRTIVCLLYHHTLPDIGVGAEPICTPHSVNLSPYRQGCLPLMHQCREIKYNQKNR